MITSPLRYDDTNYRLLLRGNHTSDGSPQCLPRQTRYGSPEALRCGLVPLTDYPDLLVQPADYKEVITACHEQKIFPHYHEERAGLLKGWNQDGYGFCWAYGITASVMDCRAIEGKKPVLLSPFSLGWLTGWSNQGYYCDRAIAGARDRGIASQEYVPQYNLRPSTFKSGWEQDALNYRALEWWDTRYSSESAMVQQMITILATGRPCYVAFNWWSHALMVTGVNFNTSVRNNVEVVLRNSHGEQDPIILTGTRAVPDELYGVRATSFSKAA